MARVLLLLPTGTAVGVTSVSLGLIQACQLAGQKVLFAKPIPQPGSSLNDPCIKMVAAATGLTPPQPIAQHTVQRHLQNGTVDELLEKVIAQVQLLHEAAEVIVVEGLVPTADFTLDVDIDRRLAVALDADVLLVAKDAGRGPEAVAAELAMHKQSLGNRVVGAIVNRAPALNETDIPAPHMPEMGSTTVPITARASFVEALQAQGLRLVGCIPDSPLVAAPRLSDVAASLHLTVVNEDSDLSRRMRSHAIGAMATGTIAERLRPGHLLVTPYDRDDILLATAVAELGGQKPGGLILTGGIMPRESMLKFCRPALRAGLPVLSSPLDTLQTATKLGEQAWPIAEDDEDRAAWTMHTIARHIDLNWLDEHRRRDRPRRLTPAAFRHKVITAAQQANKRIVLPEGDEPRTVTAAALCAERGIARPVLLGDRERIYAVAREQGVSLPDTVEIIDPAESLQNYVEPMVELRKAKGLTALAAEAALADRVVMGTMMLKLEEVDGLVSGAVHTTANTIRPALQLIKTAENCSLVSSVFFMCLPDQVMVYGDCAVNRDPTAAELADIALQSAASAEAFGIPARVAMISYSTGASGSGADVEKVIEATQLVREQRPDLAVDGPLQYDAAVQPDVAKSKAPDSPVAGQATVIIFPDLNTGNTTYKAVQRSAHVVSVGPMLQGLAKPVNDLSRGALVEDIVYTIALTAIQADQSAPRPFDQETEATLGDGASVTIRPLNSADTENLRAFHETLSDKTVRSRYHHLFPLQARQNDVRLRAIVNADQLDEIVLGVFAADNLVGVGRLNVHGSSGETAMVVSDSHQKRGIGSILKKALIEAARQRQLITLEASIDADNRAAISLARRTGYRITERDSGEVEAILEL
jgi:phosphate acetyltransferase